MNNEEKILNMIGLCKRAGKLITGESAVLESIRGKNSQLVIIAGDASLKTMKKFTDKCKSFERNFIIFSDRFCLGRYTNRQYTVTISVNDKNFAKRILDLFCENT